MIPRISSKRTAHFYFILEGRAEGTVRLPNSLLDEPANATDGPDGGSLEARHFQRAVEHALKIDR